MSAFASADLEGAHDNDWFAEWERNIRQSCEASSGRALYNAGLSTYQYFNPLALGNLALGEPAHEDSKAFRAAMKWRRKAASRPSDAAKFNPEGNKGSLGYVSVRSPRGDSRIYRTSLMDDDGMYDVRRDLPLRRALPDTDEWLEVLKESQASGIPFTDPTFPADERALFRDPSLKTSLQGDGLAAECHSWRRVGDIFQREHVLRLSFSEEESGAGGGGDGAQCYGYQSPAKPFDEADAEGVVPEESAESAAAAVEAAVNLVERCFQALEGEEREAAVAELGGAMAENFQATDFFGKLEQRFSPLSFSRVEADKSFVVKREEEPGYVPMLTIQLTLLFQPKHGVSLFESDDVGEGADGEEGAGGGELVGAGEVCQGALGDCYFLGALSMLGGNQKQLLSIFPDDKQGVSGPPQRYNEEGVYAVRFWRGDEWRVVVVDDWIPCRADGQPCFAQLPKSSCEFWPLICEKAFAKMHGSFEATELGHENEALQDLTSGVSFSVKLSGKQEGTSEDGKGGGDGKGEVEFAEELWHTTKTRLEQGSHVGISKHKDTANRCANIRSGHAYGLLQLHETESGEHQLVQVRNPWGKGDEWDGSFGDDDAESWAQIDDEEKEGMGVSDEADGTWWMPWSDLVAEFDELAVCRMMHPAEFKQQHRVVGEWKGDSAGGAHNPHLCPQFHLVVEEDCHVVVELRQPPRRHLAEGVRSYEPISPVVAGNADRHQNPFLEPRMCKSRYCRARSTVLEMDVKASDGPLSISAVAFTAGYESVFYLDVYTAANSQLTPTPDDDLPRDAVTNQLLKGSFVGFPREVEAVEEEEGGPTAEARSTVTDFVLEANKEAYRVSVAPKCGHCGEPVGVVLEGKFEGSFYPTESDGKIHAECYDQYRLDKAPVCFFCAEPVSSVGGTFSGRFFPMEQGKLHEECDEAYRKSVADKCGHCGEVVGFVVEGKFEGSYYPTDEDGKVHVECYDQYRLGKAPSCILCSKPVSSVGGEFSGKFYDMEEGKLHAECIEEYEANQGA